MGLWVSGLLGFRVWGVGQGLKERLGFSFARVSGTRCWTSDRNSSNATSEPEAVDLHALLVEGICLR